MTLFIIAVCIAALNIEAQDGANVPVIRLESRQVLVPTEVYARVRSKVIWGGIYPVPHLAARDFHLFEDGKEQTIVNVTQAFNYSVDHADNLGYQARVALTPKGEWTRLLPPDAWTHQPPLEPDSSLSFPMLSHYVIAYQPHLSVEGSCHKIEIKVDPMDQSGQRLTTAEMSVPVGKKYIIDKVETDRRGLLLSYRSQYCNVTHSATDPLYGTPASERLVRIVNSDKAEVKGFYLSAVDFYDESNTSRVRVALDFQHLSDQTGIPGFQAALLGIFSRTNSNIATRFSDSAEEGCRDIDINGDSPEVGDKYFCGRTFFFSHYETEVDLSPGDYDLRVAIDFGGALRRAEAPISVRAPEKRLAVSGIALCRRYFDAGNASRWRQWQQAWGSTLPFELTPLISKGIEFTPTGNTRFQKKDPLAAYFEVYEPLLAGGGNVHVQFEMRIVDAKTGEVKSDSGFRPADGYVNPGKAVIPISEKIAIEELRPGDYRLQVRAKDSAGNSTDWRTTSFTRE